MQNITQEDISNFERKTNNFSDPDDIQGIHSNLLGIKNDLSSIKNEATKKKENTVDRTEEESKR